VDRRGLSFLFGLFASHISELSSVLILSSSPKPLPKPHFVYNEEEKKYEGIGFDSVFHSGVWMSEPR
jgi:hypothetical protein